MKAPVLSAENTDSLHFYTEHDFKQNSAPKTQITVTLLYFKVVFVSSLMWGVAGFCLRCSDFPR